MSLPIPEPAPAEPDSRRSAYSVLSRRVTALVVGWLVVLSGLAWLASVRQSRSMSDMVSGLGQVGARMPNDMTIPIFLLMWVGMMVAMMFPTIAPIVLVQRMLAKRRGQGELPTVTFVLGYLSVWSLIGVVPLLAFLGFRSLSADAAESRWLPTLAGGILLVAGAYQFSTWKALCLGACRSPLMFLMNHDTRTAASSYRTGLAHGAYCLGCCWALMAVLVVVGLMNLVWMGVLTLVFIAEKNSRHGVELTKIVGAALIAIGISVIVSPDLLGAISGGGGLVETPGRMGS